MTDTGLRYCPFCGQSMPVGMVLQKPDYIDNLIDPRHCEFKDDSCTRATACHDCALAYGEAEA